MNEQQSRVFPIFLNMLDKQILVVGAGEIGLRRIKILLDLPCKIKVVDPNIPIEIEKEVICIRDEFREAYLGDCCMVIAATNDKSVNEEIFRCCKRKNILVNVCDNKELCDFYFPAVFETDKLIGGVVSKTGKEHALVKEAARKIRSTL